MYSMRNASLTFNLSCIELMFPKHKLIPMNPVKESIFPEILFCVSIVVFNLTRFNISGANCDGYNGGYCSACFSGEYPVALEW